MALSAGGILREKPAPTPDSRSIGWDRMCMSDLQILAVFLILVIAAWTQAITGFGFSLVCVPLLTLIAGPRAAVVGSSIVALLLTAMTVVHDRADVRPRAAGGVMFAAVLGMPLGLLVLTRLPARILTVLIALVVFAFTLMIWRGLRLAGGWTTIGAVGVLCGILTTSTGMNGPPLVAAFQAMDYPPRAFRATLAAILFGSGLLGVSGFLLSDQLTRPAATIALVGVPAVAGGWYLGNLIFTRISGPTFRRVVLVALLMTSLITLTTALR